MATVHINGTADVVLEQQDGEGWRDVCHSPCDTPLPTSARYRIGGPRVPATKPFVIVDHDGEAILDVQALRSGAFEGGIALVLVGSGAFLGGIVLALIGAVGNSICFSFSSSSCHTGDGFIIGGLVTHTAGFLGIVIGGYLIGSSKRTKVTQAGVDDMAQSPTPRVPTWNTAVERVPPSGLPIVPIYSGSF